MYTIYSFTRKFSEEKNLLGVLYSTIFLLHLSLINPFPKVWWKRKIFWGVWWWTVYKEIIQTTPQRKFGEKEKSFGDINFWYFYYISFWHFLFPFSFRMLKKKNCIPSPFPKKVWWGRKIFWGVNYVQYSFCIYIINYIFWYFYYHSLFLIKMFCQKRKIVYHSPLHKKVWWRRKVLLGGILFLIKMFC